MSTTLLSNTRRPRIVVLTGLPGSGKSTWLANNKLPSLSSDQVRLLLSDNEDNQAIHRLVFRTMRYLLRQRIAAGAPVTYIDATGLAPWERRPWIQWAILHDCAIEAVFFDTPLQECLRRNGLRPRVVPPEVIRKMAQRLVPPSQAEGFERVTVLR